MLEYTQEKGIYNPPRQPTLYSDRPRKFFITESKSASLLFHPSEL